MFSSDGGDCTFFFCGLGELDKTLLQGIFLVSSDKTRTFLFSFGVFAGRVLLCHPSLILAHGRIISILGGVQIGQHWPKSILILFGVGASSSGMDSWVLSESSQFFVHIFLGISCKRDFRLLFFSSLFIGLEQQSCSGEKHL